MPPRNARLESAEGKVLSANDADLVKQLTGVESVASTRELAGEGLQKWLGTSNVVLYTPFVPGERNANAGANFVRPILRSPGPLGRPAVARTQFVQLLRSRFAKVAVRDLTPILDEIRAVKSPQKSHWFAALCNCRSGPHRGHEEHPAGGLRVPARRLAHYVFLAGGARLEGYRSITASGTDNIWNMHYYRNTAQLKDGDLVLMDFAPEYRYYTSDIARVWPVNGKYRAPQRELLQFVLTTATPS